MTLGWLFLSEGDLENVIQLGWLETPTTLSSFLLEKLIME